MIIYDVNKKTLRSNKGKQVFIEEEKNICYILTAGDLSKRLGQLKLPIFTTYVRTISELPSDISTIVHTLRP